MKRNIQIEIDAKETNTIGKNKYLVALACGGLMEDPTVWYTNYQIISADTEEDAREKYNELNNCDFFYGKVLEKIVDK